MVKASRYLQKGFTLIEVMIVIIIIGVLAAIAYPNYQRYVIKTKRTDMMTELQNIGSRITAQKMAKGSFTDMSANDFGGDYPTAGATKLYTVTTTFDKNADNIMGDWEITAIPKPSTQMTNDGTLTLSAEGIRCRDTRCGKGQEWND